MPIVKIVRFKKQLDRTGGPFDHPAELNQAVSFCNKNGIRQLWVSTRTQQGIRKMGDVELIFIPTASFAYQLDKTGVFK